MDLKGFIKETIAAIVESTSELQAQFEGVGVIVNPPVSNKERDLYEHENLSHRYRRVETIEFDVAVTAATETSGGAKAGLKIFTAELGADGKHARNHEEVSRVKFSIPIVLSPANAEQANKTLAADARREAEERAKNARPQRGGPNSWMNR
jgi:hypothetical protein